MFLCMPVPFPTSPTTPVLGPPHFYFHFKGIREALTFPFGNSLSRCKKKKKKTCVRSPFYLRLNKDACKIHEGRAGVLTFPDRRNCGGQMDKRRPAKTERDGNREDVLSGERG